MPQMLYKLYNLKSYHLTGCIPTVHSTPIVGVQALPQWLQNFRTTLLLAESMPRYFNTSTVLEMSHSQDTIDSHLSTSRNTSVVGSRLTTTKHKHPSSLKVWNQPLKVHVNLGNQEPSSAPDPVGVGKLPSPANRKSPSMGELEQPLSPLSSPVLSHPDSNWSVVSNNEVFSLLEEKPAIQQGPPPAERVLISEVFQLSSS